MLKLIFLTITAKIFLTLVPIFIKFTTSNIWTIGIFRLTITCAVFYVFARKGFLKNLKRVWLLGPLFFIHWITYFIAVKESDPSTAVIGLSSYGFILLIYSRFFFSRKIQLDYYIGVAIALVGTYIAIGEFSFENNQFIGLLWGVASALAYGLLPIIHQKNMSVPTKHKAYAQFLGAFVIFLIFGSSEFSLDTDPANIGALVYLAVGGTIIGHTLWVKITAELPTTLTSSIYYLAIPVSMLFEFMILDIPVTTHKIVGGSMIVAGNVFVLLKSKKNKAKLAG
jgi:drug/metabolite transporter (DMT)-like permease